MYDKRFTKSSSTSCSSRRFSKSGEIAKKILMSMTLDCTPFYRLWLVVCNAHNRQNENSNNKNPPNFSIKKAFPLVAEGRPPSECKPFR